MAALIVGDYEIVKMLRGTKELRRAALTLGFRRAGCGLFRPPAEGTLCEAA